MVCILCTVSQKSDEFFDWSTWHNDVTFGQSRHRRFKITSPRPPNTPKNTFIGLNSHKSTFCTPRRIFKNWAQIDWMLDSTNHRHEFFHPCLSAHCNSVHWALGLRKEHHHSIHPKWVSLRKDWRFFPNANNNFWSSISETFHHRTGI